MPNGMNLGTVHGMEASETWDESWSWPAIEDGAVEGNAQGIQSLALSSLISDVFANGFTGFGFCN